MEQLHLFGQHTLLFHGLRAHNLHSKFHISHWAKKVFHFCRIYKGKNLAVLLLTYPLNALVKLILWGAECATFKCTLARRIKDWETKEEKEDYFELIVHLAIPYIYDMVAMGQSLIVECWKVLHFVFTNVLFSVDKIIRPGKKHGMPHSFAKIMMLILPRNKTRL